jgi:uncharacterized membrane protein
MNNKPTNVIKPNNIKLTNGRMNGVKSINGKPNGKAGTVKAMFSRETSVGITIQAPAAVVWGLLTDAPNYPKWNSTIISIEGNIKFGSTLKIKTKLDPKTVYEVKVKEFKPNEKMVWEGKSGSRMFIISQCQSGVIFTMAERLSGVLFPMYSYAIPSFDECFEQFANDLKKASERRTGGTTMKFH